jgi:hypothetical protein
LKCIMFLSNKTVVEVNVHGGLEPGNFLTLA